MTKVYAYRWVPPFAQGQVRDLRVRWALEEAGLAYEAVLIAHADRNASDYRDKQPFGQVPAFQDGELTLFESGAIVLHLGERSEALMPTDPVGRARAMMWLIAALNSIEPAVQQLGELSAFHAGKAWAAERRPELEAMVRARLADLAKALGDKTFLEGERFTVGDLMMASVLRILDGTDLVAEQPGLKAYLDRCLARPAFQRALEAQMKPFRENAPA